MKHKYSEHPDDPLTITELEIFKSQEMDKDTYDKTCDKLHVSRAAISKTKRKADYNELARAQLEQQGFNVEQYVAKLIKLTQAKKLVVVSGEGATEAEDNITQFNATSEIGDIFGAKAPKKLDLKHSMAAMSDDELAQGIEDTAKEIEGNGQTRRELTGTQDATVNIAHQRVDAEPSMVE